VLEHPLGTALLRKFYPEIPHGHKVQQPVHRENEGWIYRHRSGKIDHMTGSLEEVAREFAQAREDSARYKKLLAEAQARVATLRQLVAPAVIEAGRQGKTVTEIRELTGYSRKRIWQICRAAGVEPRE
jgi:hypothetical protein